MSQIQLENEDLDWLLDALGGPGVGSSRRMLVRPSASAPELLLPLESRAAGATSLHRYHDGKGRRERTITFGAIALARLGALRFAPGDVVDIGPFALVQRAAEVLDEPDVQIAITLGPRRRNRKPVVQLTRRDGSSVGFAKVGWSPFTKTLVENEATWLEKLDGGVPDTIQIPTVLARIDDGERTMIVTSALTTSRRSGIDGGLSSTTITELARSLGTVRRRVADLPHLSLIRSGRVSQLIDVDRLLDRHGDTVLELGLWHGDLTPWNTATIGRTSQVWDWEFADDGRPVGFDLLHMAFESVRRLASHNEANALRDVAARAAAVLEPTGQAVDATFDLYLCELMMREARLRGEGWEPLDLGPLEAHAAALLRQRLE